MPAKTKAKRGASSKRSAPARQKSVSAKGKRSVATKAKRGATKKPARSNATSTRKSAASKPAARPVKKPQTSAVNKRYNKTEILNTISDNTGLSKKEVGIVFGELENLIQRHIKKGANGEFVLPGLFKIVTVKKPARPSRMGTNPFTGEQMKFKAKPASTSVKIRPLKKLKEMAK